MEPLSQVRLSRRELEVAALVAEGLTDRQIATRLFLSERTAEGHVQAIRNKLGFDNRAQVAAWFARRAAGASGPEPAPTPLPVQLTSFVNRTRELAEIRALLQRTRLLTITGPGGAGKTRLALRAAEDRPAGAAAWFGDLGPVLSGEGVLPALAACTGSPDVQGGDILGGLARHLGRQPAQSLLVLDNCEHVLDRSAAVADRLLRACPRLRILCTSREPLLAEGEAVLRLAPLAPAEAAELFSDRAALSEPGFQLDKARAPAVADVCRRLDGMPLALELAAARVGTHTLDGVLTLLDERLDDLRRRSGPERHQTLAAAVAWSYELLSPAERRLFRRLSVFRGGFSEEAARAVAGPEASLLRPLSDRSLLVAEPGPRWRVLETIRAQAEALLEESGEAAEIRRLHQETFLEVAEEAAERLAGPDQAAWLDRLEVDRANFSAALKAAPAGEPRLRLATALHRFWLLRGSLSEGRAALDDALRAAPEPGERRALALNAAAGLAWRQGDFGAALAHLEECMALRRRLGAGGLQPILANLGTLASSQGDYPLAAGYYRDSVRVARESGDARTAAIAESNLGLALLEMGRLEEAAELLGHALAALRLLSEPALLGSALVNLALLHARLGEPERARALLRESLEALSELGASPELASALEALALVSPPEPRLRLAGAARRLREQARAPLAPSARRRLEPALAEARAEAGRRAEALLEEGGNLTLEELQALAQ